MVTQSRVLLPLALLLCAGFLIWSQTLTRNTKCEKEISQTPSLPAVTPPPTPPPSPPPTAPPSFNVRDQLSVPFLAAVAPESKKGLLYHTVSVTSKVLNTTAKFTMMQTDSIVGSTIAAGTWWEEEHIAKILQAFEKQPLEKCNVLDLGVNLGSHTVGYALYLLNHSDRYPKPCTVFGFEPQPGVFLAAAANVANNGLGNVQLFNAATLHADGQTVTMADTDMGAPVDFAQSTHGVNFGGVSLGKGGAFARGLRIDSLHFERVGLIKADIQGSEPMAFYGARELITRDKPVIFYETGFADAKLMQTILDAVKPGPVPEEAAKFDLWEFCKGLNYTMVPFGADRLLIPPPTQ